MMVGKNVIIPFDLSPFISRHCFRMLRSSFFGLYDSIVILSEAVDVFEVLYCKLCFPIIIYN